MRADYKEKLQKLKDALTNKLRSNAPSPPPTREQKRALLPGSDEDRRRDPGPVTRETLRSGAVDKAVLETQVRRASPVQKAIALAGQGFRSPQAPLEATLGIDFGTRFTKVAVYVRQSDAYSVLSLGPAKSVCCPPRFFSTEPTAYFHPTFDRPHRQNGGSNILRCILPNRKA